MLTLCKDLFFVLEIQWRTSYTGSSFFLWSLTWQCGEGTDKRKKQTSKDQDRAREQQMQWQKLNSDVMETDWEGWARKLPSGRDIWAETWVTSKMNHVMIWKEFVQIEQQVKRWEENWCSEGGDKRAVQQEHRIRRRVVMQWGRQRPISGRASWAHIRHLSFILDAMEILGLKLGEWQDLIYIFQEIF